MSAPTPSKWALTLAAKHVGHTAACWVRTTFYGRPCDCVCDQRREMLAAALDAARAQGRAEERAAVYAYFRGRAADGDMIDCAYYGEAADAVDVGAHIPPTPETTR